MSDLEASVETIVQRARDRFARHVLRTRVHTDKLFAKLFAAQWLAGIVIAVTYSPYGWAGKERAIHMHVWVAVLLGGAIASLPIALAFLKPGHWVTRHVVAVAQMLFSALLIHLSGGRIETHFHVFGSLAFLAFYLDWRVLMTATIVVAADHLIRQLVWPESVYGISNPEWWRVLEHGFWVVFCVTFLAAFCLRQIREWLGFAEEGGMIEAVAEAEWKSKAEDSASRESDGGSVRSAG